MTFQTLALMLGYDCNAKCRCCLWGDMLSRGPRIDVKEARGWIEEACGELNVQILGFSGGESFLYQDEMIELAEYAKSRYNVPSAASTNGFWAKSPEIAERILLRMRAAGLSQLLLSVDDFHQEHVPLERIKNAFEVARKLGIVSVLQCLVTKNSHKLAYYKRKLGVAKDDNLVVASQIGCTRVGWAATRIPSEEFRPRRTALTSYCSMFRPVIITPAGDVHLCCGPAFAIPGLTAGNLRQESLREILQRAEWDPLFNALVLGNGPSLLARRLKGTEWEHLRKPIFSSSCEACHCMMTTPGVSERLREKLEEDRSALFLKRVILEQESPESLNKMVNI